MTTLQGYKFLSEISEKFFFSSSVNLRRPVGAVCLYLRSLPPRLALAEGEGIPRLIIYASSRGSLGISSFYSFYS